MQDRDITTEGSIFRGVVWVADGAAMVRASPSHPRNLSEAEKTLCTLKDSDALQFQDMVRRLPNSTYLDLVDQIGPDYEEFKRPLSGFEDPDTIARTNPTVPTSNRVGQIAPASSETAPLPEIPFTMPPSSSAEVSAAPVPCPRSENEETST